MRSSPRRQESHPNPAASSTASGTSSRAAASALDHTLRGHSRTLAQAGVLIDRGYAALSSRAKAQPGRSRERRAGHSPSSPASTITASSESFRTTDGSTFSSVADDKRAVAQIEIRAE